MATIISMEVAIIDFAISINIDPLVDTQAVVLF
jgi:hypothetical protein